MRGKSQAHVIGSPVATGIAEFGTNGFLDLAAKFVAVRRRQGGRKRLGESLEPVGQRSRQVGRAIEKGNGIGMKAMVLQPAFIFFGRWEVPRIEWLGIDAASA